MLRQSTPRGTSGTPDLSPPGMRPWSTRVVFCLNIAVADRPSLGYPTRMEKHIYVLLALTTVWAALAGGDAWAALVVGVPLAVTILLVVRRLVSGEGWLGRDEQIVAAAVPRRGAWARFAAAVRRVVVAAVFVPVFLAKVFVAGFGVAIMAFKPSMDFWPGIVRVRGGMRTVTATSFFGTAITLTPGTLTLDYDERDDVYFVHWIDITGYGTAEFDALVTANMRGWFERMER